MLAPYEGVVACESGHVNVHEAGAIEYTGHKVLALSQHEGKLDAGELEEYLATFYADENHEHMVFPGLVYISHPTEYGTLYSLAELEAIRAACDAYNLKLFLDGARLGYGLVTPGTDVSLADVARLTDVFYIGGTKVGALIGEAVVFPRHGMPAHFATMVKQHGAMLAKGRLLGIQFDVLFTDGLYMRIAKNAIECAEGCFGPHWSRRATVSWLRTQPQPGAGGAREQPLPGALQWVGVRYLWERVDADHTAYLCFELGRPYGGRTSADRAAVTLAGHRPGAGDGPLSYVPNPVKRQCHASPRDSSSLGRRRSLCECPRGRVLQ